MFLSVFHSVSDIHIHIQIHGSVTQAAACMMNVCHFMYLSAGRLDNGQKCKNFIFQKALGIRVLVLSS